MYLFIHNSIALFAYLEKEQVLEYNLVGNFTKYNLIFGHIVTAPSSLTNSGLHKITDIYRFLISSHVKRTASQFIQFIDKYLLIYSFMYLFICFIINLFI